MITRRELLERADEVTHIIKWWVSMSDRRYHYVMIHGSVEDFVNDVWLRLLTNVKDGKVIDFTLSTVVSHTCKWELVSYRKIGTRKYRKARKALREAVKVKSWHKTSTDDHVVDYAEERLLNERIAAVLRSLTKRQAMIIRARFGLLGDVQMTYRRIGKSLGLSCERVRQIELKGLKTMQRHGLAKLLAAFYVNGSDCENADLSMKKIAVMRKTEMGALLADELVK